MGKGGFGIVYAGVRNRDGMQVAIKHIAKAKIKDWGQVRKMKGNVTYIPLISALTLWRAKSANGAARHPLKNTPSINTKYIVVPNTSTFPK